MARTAVLCPAQAFAAPPVSGGRTKRNFANKQLKGAGPIALTHGLAAKHRTLMSASWGLPNFPDEKLALPYVGASTAFGGGPLSRSWQPLGATKGGCQRIFSLLSVSCIALIFEAICSTNGCQRYFLKLSRYFGRTIPGTAIMDATLVHPF
jgi:hypothetical protein